MYGYKVIAAKDGIEALAVLVQTRHKVEIMLIDIAIPSLDGISIAGKSKNET